MKPKKPASDRQRQTLKPNVKLSTEPTMPSKKQISPRTGQYPAKLGFHGTDDEKNLSPEE